MNINITPSFSSKEKTILGKRSNREDLKEDLKELAASQSQEKRNKTSDTIAEMSLEKFDSSVIQPLSQMHDFQSRIKHCKSFFNKQERKLELLVTGPDKNWEIKITIWKDKFRSSSFKKKFFLEPTLGKKQRFIYFAVKESNKKGIFKELLLVSSSKQGSFSELTSIKKGKNLSGNHVFDIFYTRIEAIIQAKKTFLYDDALMKISNPDDPQEDYGDLPIRALRVLGRMDKTSWYESKGFSILHCKKFPLLCGNLSQVPNIYHASTDRIRNTPLSYLLSIQKKYEVEESLTEDLQKKYLSYNKDETIHDLVHSILKQMSLPEKKFEACIDFNNFYLEAIEPWGPEECDKEDVPFFNALDVFDNSRIFSRESL